MGENKGHRGQQRYCYAGGGRKCEKLDVASSHQPPGVHSWTALAMERLRRKKMNGRHPTQRHREGGETRSCRLSPRGTKRTLERDPSCVTRMDSQISAS